MTLSIVYFCQGVALKKVTAENYLWNFRPQGERRRDVCYYDSEAIQSFHFVIIGLVFLETAIAVSIPILIEQS